MSFFKIKFFLLLAALAGTASACGPFFPSTIIDQPDALLAAPFARFADSLAKIPLPAAEFRAVNTNGNKSNSEQTLAAELADLSAAGVPAGLIERHRIRRATLAALKALPAGQPLPAELTKTDGLPPEFAEYHTATCAYLSGDTATAIRLWQHLLARPAAERKYKSAWAAYMLGRTAGQEEDARAYYQKTRQLAREGCADTLGLAAASLGWEAKTWLDAGNFPRAADLYLAQFSAGDPTAAISLRTLATRVLACNDAPLLRTFAGDARLREIITALFLSQREEALYLPDMEVSPADRTGATARWLTVLEQAGVIDSQGAPRLALAAYRAGEFTLTARWLKLAPADDALVLWLQAKLALRAGDLDGAANKLSLLIHRAIPPADSLAGLWIFEMDERETPSAESHLLAELGALKLARRDYTEALELLLRAGYWEDSAYIAEQVLTVDELKIFVDSRVSPSAPTTPPTGENSFPSHPDIRHLLARRLVRHDRLGEARAYFPEKLIPTFDRFVVLLHAGQDTAQPAAVRAAALMDAARLMRAEGMALRGTELGPDCAIWEGGFSGGLNLVSRARLPDLLRPSADELARSSLPEIDAGHRFHYRYTAADLAWTAITLMPDDSEVTARALTEAGGWLKARDPRTANRFYQALVRRCRHTPQGEEAARKHWFPYEKL